MKYIVFLLLLILLLTRCATQESMLDLRYRVRTLERKVKHLRLELNETYEDLEEYSNMDTEE